MSHMEYVSTWSKSTFLTDSIEIPKIIQKNMFSDSVKTSLQFFRSGLF